MQNLIRTQKLGKNIFRNYWDFTDVNQISSVNKPSALGGFRFFSKTSCNKLEKSPPPIEFLNQRNHRTTQSEKTTPYGWIMLIIPITTFGLGCWQVKRKQWKESLIKDLEIQTSKPPIDFPDEIELLDNMEYQSVKVRGEYLHDQEQIIGPRSLIQPNDDLQKGGLITRQDTSMGFLVITPFKIEGRDDVILVNRGWVPKKQLNPISRAEGQVKGPVELIGIVRKTENRPQFSPKNSKDNYYLYRDIPQMCSVTGAEPYFLDATIESTVRGGPIGGQTRVTLRNEHLSYIVTWFSLSIVTSYLWYRQIYKRIPR